MPSFSTRVIGGPDENEEQERRQVLEHFRERSEGWDCKTCAAYVNGRPLSGPQKHLAWHESIGG